MDTLNLPALRALGFLTLLTLADTIASSSVPAVLGRSTPLDPGYWNLGAVAVVVSTFTELIAQLGLGVLADGKSKGYAVLSNISSIAMSSLSIILTLHFRASAPSLPFIIPSLLKIIGGGSHATIFLTLVLLRERISGTSRVYVIFALGAIMTLCQAAGTAVAPRLLKRGESIPGVIAIVFCILAYLLLAVDLRLNAEPVKVSNEPEPLLGELHEPQEPHLYRVLSSTSKIFAFESIYKDRNLATVGLVFFTAGISKATRPLFTTYIQRRYGFSPDQASQLWLMRTAIAVAVFAAILPLAVFIQLRRNDNSPSKASLLASKASISIMGTGALMIGLARTGSFLVAALVINSLGIANDFSLLAFVSEVAPVSIAGRTFMLIGSLESLGSLIGVGVLYPVYQWSLTKESWAGGSAYYICATLYAIVAALIWQLKPSRIAI
ncbi:hypothetical protein DL98DRAFT_85772 [Cadophora sp. DSE1049]|nr:hypothetical protein DL98DRAFT_85772 [Cadophora sp. DSE1049]